jgi:hypothetical protein
MFESKMDHIMSYNVTLAAPEIIGEVPEGFRANFYVTGGTISGPKVLGKFRPAGGDWLLLRRDGVAILDIEATAETCHWRAARRFASHRASGHRI